MIEIARAEVSSIIVEYRRDDDEWGLWWAFSDDFDFGPEAVPGETLAEIRRIARRQLLAEGLDIHRATTFIYNNSVNNQPGDPNRAMEMFTFRSEGNKR